jgi:hypothetical protein
MKNKQVAPLELCLTKIAFFYKQSALNRAILFPSGLTVYRKNECPKKQATDERTICILNKQLAPSRATLVPSGLTVCRKNEYPKKISSRGANYF